MSSMTHSKECRYPLVDTVSHYPVFRRCFSYPMIPLRCQLSRSGTGCYFTPARRKWDCLHRTTDTYMTQMTSVFVNRTGLHPRYSGIGKIPWKLSPRCRQKRNLRVQRYFRRKTDSDVSRSARCGREHPPSGETDRGNPRRQAFRNRLIWAQSCDGLATPAAYPSSLRGFSSRSFRR